MSSKIDPKYHPSGLNSTFPYSVDLPFAEYILRSREMVAKSRVDLNSFDQNFIIDANAPFEWIPTELKSVINNQKKAKNGILLIHGLLDSPYSLHDLGRFFLAQNFVVRSILLPGHGTRPGDLIGATADAWIKAAHYGIHSLNQTVENVHVLGISGGAGLALYHALQGMPIKALFLMAPLLQIKSKLVPLISLWPYFKRKLPEGAWFKQRDDLDYAKYESIPYDLIYQAYALTQKIKLLVQQQPLKLPLWMVTSYHDETIDSRAAVRYFKKQEHPLSSLIIYNSKLYADADTRIEHRMSAFPQQNILNFSHVCLSISPLNPHYGIQGDYPLPLSTPKKNQSATSENIYYGALNKANIKHFRVKRLTYNPDFENMLVKMKMFLLSISNS